MAIWEGERGELSENKLDLLTTKVSLKGNFAQVAFLTFTLIFIIIMFVMFSQFYGTIWRIFL